MGGPCPREQVDWATVWASPCLESPAWGKSPFSSGKCTGTDSRFWAARLCSWQMYTCWLANNQGKDGFALVAAIPSTSQSKRGQHPGLVLSTLMPSMEVWAETYSICVEPWGHLGCNQVSIWGSLSACIRVVSQQQSLSLESPDRLALEKTHLATQRQPRMSSVKIQITLTKK